MILPSPEQIKLELARRDLIEYARRQWPEYRANEHHYAIADVLQRVAAGEIKRLMIFAPPRHGKSVLTSEFFPPWFLGNNPDKYIIHATYAQELAEDFGRKIRNQMQDQLFSSIFPRCKLSADSASQKRLTTTSGGAYFALGVGGAATGRGAHIFLIDDPIKNREDAESDTYRRRLKDWYRAVAYTRLMPNGAVVIMLTRWHHDDLAGWLLREHAGQGFHVLSLPAMAEENDPLGREIGAPLWPSDYPLSALEEIKLQLGSRDWSALYQQRPTPEEGSIFKMEWFKRYRNLPANPRMILHSWDTGTKDNELNDPTSFQAWHDCDNGFYLADRFNSRLQFPDLLRAIQSFAVRDNPHAILIEDKGSGQQAIQVLRRETRLPVIPVNPIHSKIIRAQGQSGICEAGRVWLPEAAAWLIDFEAEVSAFPNAPHDDDVDAMTQALAYLTANRRPETPGQESAWKQISSTGAM
jgi:predicted phage terminase large subunit-like protein